MRDHFSGNRGRTLLATIVCATVCLAVAGLARADEASGRWTGELEGRGNYYWERSTRVMLPSGRLQLESPNGVRMNVEYLVDVISTASVGARADNKDNVFTELRHSVGAGAGKLFTLGDNELDVSTHVVHSFETDYYSWIYGARAAYTFNQKNTTLSLGLTGVHDKIYKNIGPDMYDPTFRGRLDGVTTSLGLSQILSPTVTVGLSYQLVYLTGFLGNHDVRVSTEPIVDEESFMNGFAAKAATTAAEALHIPAGTPAGNMIEANLGGLSAETHYYVGVRAVDGCATPGPVSVAEITTERRIFATVTPCFVATAAYGTPLAAEISALRRFRDRHLANNVVGRAFVTAYGEIGPKLANIIRQNDGLRAASRVMLAPAVALARLLED